MKILVFRPDQLGDVILATPVFENLKNNYPDAEIISLTGTWAKKIIDNNPFIDKKIYYDYAFFNRDKKYKIHQIILNIFNLIRIVRKEKIDIFVDLKSHLKSLLICYTSNAKTMVGKSNGFKGLLLNLKIQYRTDIYELENNLNVISTFCEVKTKKINLYPYGNDLINIKSSEKKNKKIVSIFPYAPSPIKRLPSSYWQKIIFLLNTKNITVFLLGAKDSLNFIKQINYDKSTNKSFIGKYTVYESYQILKQTDYCITLDTFGSHLANAADIPTFVIYTYANPKQWSPKSDYNYFIHKKFNCFPCNVPFNLEICKYDNRCLRSITYNEFEEKVKKFIDIK